MSPSKNKNEGDTFPVRLTEGHASSIYMPQEEREPLDAVLDYIKQTYGRKYSRSEFVRKAIKHYLGYLLKGATKEELRQRLGMGDAMSKKAK